MSKTVLGLSVALVAGFCIGTTFIVTGVPILAGLRYHFVVAWGIVALALWAVAGYRRLKSSKTAPADPPRADAFEEGAPRRREAYAGLTYWGVMAAVFAGISQFITPWNDLRANARTEPPPEIRPKPTNEASIPIEKARDPFEELRGMKLRGVTLQGQRSCALLNDKTYFLGETVFGAKLTRIESAMVTFERDGQKLELHMGR